MGCIKKNNTVALEHLKSSENLKKSKKCSPMIKSNILVILLILSMVGGIGAGIGLREVWSPNEHRKLSYFNFPGEILLNMLKVLILPLIVSSLISSLASLDTRASGKIGLRAIVYYLSTTIIAVLLGILFVMTIKPGLYGNVETDDKPPEKEISGVDALLDLIRNCFPDNLVAACLSKKTTELKLVDKTDENNTSLLDDNTTTKEYNIEVKNSPGINMLGIVVLSIFFGVTIGRLEEKGKPLLDFFTSLYDASMMLVTLVIWYSPIGIFFLIATQVIKMKDPEIIIQRLGLYCVTVLVGLICHGFIILPLLYFIIVRKNPFIYMYNMLKALITALATSSSSATLPVTIECLEVRNKVDPRITKFVVPIGATVNMDGTALYEAVASIFIGQVNGMSMDVGKVVTVSITATAAAIGAAGIPQAGLVTMMIVLTAVGLPTKDIALILAVDWFLDRCRTTINVIGDAYGAGILAKLSQKDLDAIDRTDNPELNGKIPYFNEVMSLESDEEVATQL